MSSKSTLLLFLVLFTSTFLNAQNVGCDGNRYINHVFDSVKVTLNVQYGSATNLSGSTKTLLMDIYEPANDNISERPVVILAHGGSFVGGDRSEFAPICEDLAKRGYVAATINYRLIDQLLFDSTAFSEIVVMATLDMKAAVRFFRADAVNDDVYKVDPALIIVGGASAGGVSSSHAAFMDSTDNIPTYILNHINDNGGFEGNSNLDNLLYSSEVQSLLNYSGSLGRVNFIDSNDPPFYSAHDEFDEIVPCGYNTSDILPFPVYSYGSCEMQARADDLGITNDFHLLEDSDGHVSYFTNGDTAQINEILAESVEFIEAVICGETNDEPEAADDSKTTELNTPISVSVLENDFDSDGQLNSNSVTILDEPTNGTAAVNQDGSITYTPNTGFFGDDSFTYLVCDDGSPVLCSKANVDVSVSTPTALFNNSNADLFKVYPNPAKDFITIQLKKSSSDYSIEMYSLTGKMVYKSANSNLDRIDISAINLNSGSYIIHLFDAKNQEIAYQKLVIF